MVFIRKFAFRFFPLFCGLRETKQNYAFLNLSTQNCEKRLAALIMESKKENYIKLYTEVSSIPSITSAMILPGKDETTLNIHSSWTAQDLVKLEKSSFSKDYSFDVKTFSITSTTLPYDISSVRKQAYNKSRCKQAVLREKKSLSNNECYDLEIWNEFRKEHTFELTDHEDHGKINTNNFSCLSWSSDDKYILYTAEAKKPKSSSYFKILKSDIEDSKKEETRQNQGQEYIYREEWGEDFLGSHHSVLVILEISTGKTKIVSFDDVDNQLTVGEAVWGPNDKTIILVGYDEFPQRLGIRSCTNRRSAIYSYDCETSAIECISSKDVSVRCPRFSPDFKNLFYLENTVGGPHSKGSKLQKYECSTKKITTLVDLVNYPKRNEFPGLSGVSIPQECFFENHMFLTCQWRSLIAILSINTTNGAVSKMEQKIPLHPEGKGETFGASTVLNVYKDLILAEFSSINIEPCLVIGQLLKGNPASVEWKYLDYNAPVRHDDIEWKIVQMNESKDYLNFEVILITPSNKESKLSAIIRPHGGPHSAYSAGFSRDLLSFTKLGYINCLVNYRGSTGFGEINLHSLPGNIGINDVSDVQQSAEYVKNHPDFTVNKCFVIGGSHGGFLGAHLIGQYPDFYSAAVLKNPVIDIAGMTETTDIPDWNWVEAGNEDVYSTSNLMKPDHLKAMWDKSPIQFINNVRTPVLLLLGNKDLRVPYYQGLKYYKFLKSKKVPVSAYVYEDNHSLSKTPHNADDFMQTVLWLEKYSA